MAIHPAHIFTVALGGGGAVFLAIGLNFLLSDAPEHEVDRVEALHVYDTGTWKNAALGDPVLVEGRIAADNPPVFMNFVACRREKYAGKKSGGKNQAPVEQWSLIGVFAPSLRLGTGPDEGLAVVNSGYELREPLHGWRDENVGTDLFQDVGERAAGFWVGDLVTVDGRVVQGGVEAVRLIGGDAATYRANTRRQVQVAGILGLVFTPIGLVLFVGGAFIGWRTRRASRLARR